MNAEQASQGHGAAMTPPAMNATDEILGPALARGDGEAIALIAEDRQLSFAALDRLCNRFGNALRAAGTEVGERVIFLLDDSPELVAGYLGAMRIGAVAVALNVRLSPRDLAFALADAAPRVLFVHAAFADLLGLIEADPATRKLLPSQIVIVGGDDATLSAFLADSAETLASVPMPAEAMAFWIYSSGTTGRSKAAVHSQRDVLIADLHLRRNLGVGPGDRVFTTSKIFFAFALGHSLFGALRCGATVIVFEGWPDAAAVARVVRRQRPTLVFSVPTMYRNLLREGCAEDEAFRAVRHYVSAGEKLPESLFQEWIEATHLPILEGVGTSETIFLAIANTPRSYRAGSSGRPQPWVETILVDEHGQPVTAPDVPGLLGLRMGSVFAQYWGQPEQTRKALRDGWYFSGDMFSVDAGGWWYHQGRADDMIKISGQWVSPAEIEECALQVPDLAEVAVVGVANADGLVRLAMFAVAREARFDASRLTDAIQETLRATLSIYKCPRTIRFVDALPRTATGKTQKFVLKQLIEAGSAA